MHPSTFDWLEQLRHPPAEFGAVPFWFWNDDLDEAELLRQLRAFHDGGCGGVLIHPRVGLSARVGYLTPEYFRLVRLVTDECARLGMRVILYDESSYPSGSACGQVVAENPDYAARALVLQQRDVQGPWCGYWRVADGRSLVAWPVCAVLARVRPSIGTSDPSISEGDGGGRNDTAAAIDPDTLTLLPIGDRGLVRVDVGPGDWRLLACLDVPSGGRIRGALPEQDDGMATAPPAGDLMNPAAVAAFIRLTHDRYAEALGEHLGTTVVAMFTDEPSPLGRGARRTAWPYTAGFDERVAARLGREVDELLTWLPALWTDYGPGTDAFRADYTAAVEAHIGEVFYGAQAEWCATRGIALTGHPHSSNDMASLARFHWPGQDAVWRWVAPRDGTALEGEHSVSAKAATSAARAAGRRRSVTELFGAYGWGLSLDEVKWLIDWHLARGANLFIPHACFYSVRDGRAFESEPDVALHNCWWPHFQTLLRYVARLSWLLTDCEHFCHVAVVGAGYALPWRAVRRLYEAQVDFLYLDSATIERAAIGDRELVAGSQRYRAAVLDGEPQLSVAARQRLVDFQRAGGLVFEAPLSESDTIDLAAAGGVSDFTIEPPAPDLRVIHVRKEGADVYALFNEGEAEITGRISVGASGTATWVDPLRMDGSPIRTIAPDKGVGFTLRLPRRECRLLVLTAGQETPAGRAGEGRARVGGSQANGSGPAAQEWSQLAENWTVVDADGRRMQVGGLGDWTTVQDLERFSGTLRYVTSVTLPARALDGLAVVVDLGTAGEVAEVRVNGSRAGEALWAPYVVVTPASLWRAGENELEVRVTNSAANHYEGAMRPSGLMGPVTLHGNS